MIQQAMRASCCHVDKGAWWALDVKRNRGNVNIKAKVEKNAVWALVVASIAPPPFPFTPFIMAAAALQYPRVRLLAVTGVARMARFTALGVLALLFGRNILRWAQSGAVQLVLVGLIVLCTVGSVISVIGWIKRSRNARQPVRQ